MFIFESIKRSWIKAITYRVLGTLATALIAYLLTSDFTLALGAGGLDALLKIIIYFAHERAWNQIEWGKNQSPSAVIWFTGLSGSGKSTLAKGLEEHYLKKGFKVELLDGDIVRKELGVHGYSREERIRHLKFMGYLAAKLVKQNTIVLCSFITPYEEARRQIRDLGMTNYIEVWVDTPLEVCEKRDVKGLYAKSRKGEIQHFTGHSDSFERPKCCDIRITTQASIEETLALLINQIEERKSSLAKKA